MKLALGLAQRLPPELEVHGRNVGVGLRTEDAADSTTRALGPQAGGTPIPNDWKISADPVSALASRPQ